MPCADITAPRVIVLDFDGVIIESNEVKTTAFRQVFERFPEHTAAMMSFHNAHIPLGRFHKFRHLLKLLDRENDEVLLADIAADFSSRVSELVRHVPFVAGAEEFLDRFSSRVPLYMASVTPFEELEATLADRDLGRWFRDVYGCPPWTKPKALCDVCSREGVEPKDVLLIGDSSGDQQAALESGIAFLARNSGLAFQDPQPMIFADMFEVGRYLEDFYS